MPSVSDEPKTATKPVSSFRQSVGSIGKKNKWVSPFRQQPASEVNASTGEKHEKAESSDTSVPATKKQKVAEDKKPVDKSINPKDLEKRLGALAATADNSTLKKIKPEDRIVDLGGGLKMSQAAIDKIARERLGKDLEQIDERATEQQKLRDLKHRKKLELQALKDQNKVNSRFAKFKKKLDLEKKTILSEHDKKVKEVEASLASLDQQIKDFDKKTTKEIQQSNKEAELQTKAADEKLVKDKETTAKEAANLEKEHLQTIHDHQISQKRSEITSRVLHAKQSEYELELELLELKLAQSNRELAKKKEHNEAHANIKSELEAQIATTKQAIAENTAKIEKSETTQLESAKSLKSAEGELEASKESVASLKAQLAELKAGKTDRETRLQEAIAQRKIYDEEQEKLRLEAEEKARIAEEEEKKRKAEEEERQRVEAEEKAKAEEEERQRKSEEEERLRKEEEEKAKAEEEARLKAEEEKKKKHAIAVAAFDDDLTSRKDGLDKEIQEKKASNGNPDDIALLELERNHLNDWSYENKDEKTKDLDTSLARTKKDQQVKAALAEKEAKRKAVIAEKEEKKKAALAAKEQKKKEKEQKKKEKEEKKKNKSHHGAAAVAVPAAVGGAALGAVGGAATGAVGGAGKGSAHVAGGAGKGAANAASGLTPSGKSASTPDAKAVEPASSTSDAPVTKSADTKASAPAAVVTEPTTEPVTKSDATASEPVAKSSEPTDKSAVPAAAAVAAVPLAKETSKSSAPLTRESTSSVKDGERKSRRSSLFGFFGKKNKDKSVSPDGKDKDSKDREDEKKKKSLPLGAAVFTGIGTGAAAGVAGGVAAGEVTSNGVLKSVSAAPGGPVALSKDAETPRGDVETKDATVSDAPKDLTANQPTGTVGSTDAIKDGVPQESVTADKEAEAEPSAIAPAVAGGAAGTAVGATAASSASSSAPTEAIGPIETDPVAAEKSTQLGDEATPVATEDKESGILSDLQSSKSKQVVEGTNFGGSDIENVTGSEFQTKVIQDGENPILAIQAADPNISLEEITLEQAKHEDNVLAVVAGHDSTLQEVDRSELYSAQTQPPKSKASDIVFDQSRGPDTAPTTAGDVDETSSAIPADTAAGIAAATGAAGAGYALGHDVGQNKSTEAPAEGQAYAQTEPVPQDSEVPSETAAGITGATGAAGAGYALGSAVGKDEKVKDKSGDVEGRPEIESPNVTSGSTATLTSKKPETSTPYEPSKSSSTPTGVAAGIAAATGAAGAGYALGHSVGKSKTEEKEDTPLASEEVPKEGSTIEPAPTNKGALVESDSGAEVNKTPLNSSSNVEPALESSTGPSREAIGAAIGASTAAAVGGTAISNKDDEKTSDIPKAAEPLTDSSAAPKVVAVSDSHKFPTSTFEEPKTENVKTLDPGVPADVDLSTSDYNTTSREATPEPDLVPGTFVTPSPAGKGKNAKKNKKKREAAKKKKKLAASPEPESAPSKSVDPASGAADAGEHTLGESAGAIGGAVAGTVVGTLAAGAAAVGLTSGGDDSKDSKESPKEETSAKDESLPTGTYTEPKAVSIPKDQKFSVQPSALKSAETPSSTDKSTATTTGADTGVGAGVLGALGLSSKSDEPKTGSYQEPKPVEIPEDQKFTVSPKVSNTKSTGAETTESDEGPTVLQTATAIATGVALTGAAVYESTKDKVVNAYTGEADEDKATDVTLKDTSAAENLSENKDAPRVETVDTEYYSLDPKRASNRLSQNDSLGKTGTTSKSDVADSEKKDSTTPAVAASAATAGLVGGVGAASSGKDSKPKDSLTSTKTPEAKSTPTKAAAKPSTTTPKKPVAAKQQEEPKSGKKFGFKKFWKSDKKQEEVKPVAATATPVKKSGKPNVVGTTPAKKDTKTIPDNVEIKKTPAGLKSVVKEPESTTKKPTTSEGESKLSIGGLAGATGAAAAAGTAAIVGSSSGSEKKSSTKPTESKSTDAPAATNTTTTATTGAAPAQHDNDSLYSYHEVYVYEEVSDVEDEGLVTKAINYAKDLSSTVV